MKMLRRLLISVQKSLLSQQLIHQPVTYYYTTPSVEAVPTNSSRNLPKPAKGQSYSTLMANAEKCLDPPNYYMDETKSQVLDLISLKKLLSSNPEMKRLIVKLAESLQEIGEVRHPFVRTAGYVLNSLFTLCINSLSSVKKYDIYILSPLKVPHCDIRFSC